MWHITHLHQTYSLCHHLHQSNSFRAKSVLFLSVIFNIPVSNHNTTGHFPENDLRQSLSMFNSCLRFSVALIIIDAMVCLFVHNTSFSQCLLLFSFALFCAKGCVKGLWRCAAASQEDHVRVSQSWRSCV